MLDAIMLNVVAPFTQSSKLTVIVARKYKTNIEEFFMANQPPFFTKLYIYGPNKFYNRGLRMYKLGKIPCKMTPFLIGQFQNFEH